VRDADNGNVATATTPNRQDLVRQGQRVEYFTIAYNGAEGLVSVVAGLIAGSVSLIGFGLDSGIEVASGAALLWRLHYDLNRSRRELVERITLRIVGWCFVALALYILYESGSTLIRHQPPERSIPGIIVAAAGTAIALYQIRGLIALALLWLGFTIKRRTDGTEWDEVVANCEGSAGMGSDRMGRTRESTQRRIPIRRQTSNHVFYDLE